jgi:glutamine amidotransferase
MIAIIDYGMGNLGSVKKALDFLGQQSVITDDAAIASSADAMILPGVGAISHAMQALTEKHLDRVVYDFIDTDKPFLGICLGMQMLFETSDEHRSDGRPVKGLGILPGSVLRFSPEYGLKVPQIGWNNLADVRHSDMREGDYVYFVHSYYCVPDRTEDITATASYGLTYAAAVARENVTAMQFHPEKSGEAGIAILNRWARRIK